MFPLIEEFDGRYHEIRVKLDVPGVKTSYRTGYFADDPKRQPKKAKVETDPLKAVLQDAAPESGQIPFYSRVVPVTPQPDLSNSAKRNGDFGPRISGPVVRYGIDWNVKFSAIQTTAAANGIHQGQVTFAAVVYDSEGKTRNSLVNTLELNLTPARFAQLTRDGLPIHQELDLPMQDVVLRLAVIDRGSGKTKCYRIRSSPAEIQSWKNKKRRLTMEVEFTARQVRSPRRCARRPRRGWNALPAFWARPRAPALPLARRGTCRSSS
jgi:hypothetical protein